MMEEKNILIEEMLEKNREKFRRIIERLKAMQAENESKTSSKKVK